MIGKKGKDAGLDPAAADRHPALPLRRTSSRAASGRARARSATALGPGRPAQPGQGKAGDRAGRARARGRADAGRAGRRSWARSCSCRASSPRASERIVAEKDRYTGIRTHRARSRCATSSAPTSRRCGGRSRSGTYDPKQPDHRPGRARTSATARGRSTPLPQSNAVIIYMMDVSGSMGDEQKEIVRIESLLDRHLAAPPVQGPRDALHHPRRGGPRGRPRHLLPHPRVGRHDDQLGLQAVREDDRGRLPAVASGTSTRSTSPTATTGRSTTPRQCIELLEERHPAQREPVLLRPGREPLRLGPVHQGPAASTSTRTTTAWRSREIADKDAIYGLDQGLPREGEVDAMASSATAPADLRRHPARRSRATRASYGLDFYDIDLRGPRLRRDQRDRRLRRLPDPLPALAVRHGVRAALQGLPLRAPEDLRDGHQQRPLLRLPAASATSWSTRSWSWPTSTATTTSSRTTICFSQTNRKMMDEMANHGTRIRRYMERLGDGDGRGLHRQLPVAREPDRHALAVHQAARRRRAATTSRPRSEDDAGGRRSSRARTTWTRSSTRPAFLEEQAKQKEAERQKAEAVPRAARARRPAVPARARAARAPGSATSSTSSARRPTTSPRRARPRS